MSHSYDNNNNRRKHSGSLPQPGGVASGTSRQHEQFLEHQREQQDQYHLNQQQQDRMRQPPQSRSTRQRPTTSHIRENGGRGRPIARSSNSNSNNNGGACSREWKDGGPKKYRGGEPSTLESMGAANGNGGVVELEAAAANNNNRKRRRPPREAPAGGPLSRALQEQGFHGGGNRRNCSNSNNNNNNSSCYSNLSRRSGGGGGGGNSNRSAEYDDGDNYYNDNPRRSNGNNNNCDVFGLANNKPVDPRRTFKGRARNAYPIAPPGSSLGVTMGKQPPKMKNPATMKQSTLKSSATTARGRPSGSGGSNSNYLSPSSTHTRFEFDEHGNRIEVLDGDDEEEEENKKRSMKSFDETIPRKKKKNSSKNDNEEIDLTTTGSTNKKSSKGRSNGNKKNNKKNYKDGFVDMTTTSDDSDDNDDDDDSDNHHHGGDDDATATPASTTATATTNTRGGSSRESSSSSSGTSNSSSSRSSPGSATTESEISGSKQATKSGTSSRFFESGNTSGFADDDNNNNNSIHIKGGGGDGGEGSDEEQHHQGRHRSKRNKASLSVASASAGATEATSTDTAQPKPSASKSTPATGGSLCCDDDDTDTDGEVESMNSNSRYSLRSKDNMTSSQPQNPQKTRKRARSNNCNNKDDGSNGITATTTATRNDDHQNDNGDDIQFEDDDDDDGMSDNELFSKKARTTQRQQHHKKKSKSDNNKNNNNDGDDDEAEVTVVDKAGCGDGVGANRKKKAREGRRERNARIEDNNQDSISMVNAAVNASQSCVYTPRDGAIDAPKASRPIQKQHGRHQSAADAIDLVDGDDGGGGLSTHATKGSLSSGSGSYYGSAMKQAAKDLVHGLAYSAQEIAGSVFNTLNRSASGGPPPQLLLKTKVNNNKSKRPSSSTSSVSTRSARACKNGKAQSVLEGHATKNAPVMKAAPDQPPTGRFTDNWWDQDNANNEPSSGSAEEIEHQLCDSGDDEALDNIKRLKRIKKRGTSTKTSSRLKQKGFKDAAFSFGKSGNRRQENDPDFTPSSRGHSASTRVGTKRTTRSSSRTKKAPKDKGSPECIDLLDDETDEESDFAAYKVGSHSSFKPSWIAIGKKLYGPTGCGIALDNKSQKLIIKYTQKELGEGRRTRRSPDGFGAGAGVSVLTKVSILADQVQQVRFYHPQQKDAGSLLVNNNGEPMGFLALHANAGFNVSDNSMEYFDPTADASTGKTYIVVEMQPDDLSCLLAHMNSCSGWNHHVESCTDLPADEAELLAQSLLTDKRRLQAKRFQSSSAIDEGFLVGKADKDELLVYPFAASVDKTVLEKASEGLTELGPIVGISNSHTGQEAESSSSSDVDDATKELANTTDTSDDRPKVAAKEKKGDGDKPPAGKGKRQGRAHHVTIQVGDYRRLDPGTYLNDTLIDFFIQWMSRNDDRSQVHFFSTHFYTALSDEGVASVTKWTANKNINIFKKKLIFIPVNKSLHWSLCVVVNCGEIQKHLQRLKLKEDGGEEDLSMDDPMPCLIFLDPMESYHQKRQVKENILKWLNSEWRRINSTLEEPFSSKAMDLISPKVPYQDNGYDCGVFVCRYGSGMYALRDRNFSYAECNKGTGKKRCRDLITQSTQFSFDNDDIDRIRLEMKQLIKKLSEVHASWKADVAEEKRRQKALKRKQPLEQGQSKTSSEEADPPCQDDGKLPALLGQANEVEASSAVRLDRNEADAVKPPPLPCTTKSDCLQMSKVEGESSSSLLEDLANPLVESNSASLMNNYVQKPDESTPPLPPGAVADSPVEPNFAAAASLFTSEQKSNGSGKPLLPGEKEKSAFDEAKGSVTVGNDGTAGDTILPLAGDQKANDFVHPETTDQEMAPAVAAASISNGPALQAPLSHTPFADAGSDNGTREEFQAMTIADPELPIFPDGKAPPYSVKDQAMMSVLREDGSSSNPILLLDCGEFKQAKCVIQGQEDNNNAPAPMDVEGQDNTAVGSATTAGTGTTGNYDDQLANNEDATAAMSCAEYENI